MDTFPPNNKTRAWHYFVLPLLALISVSSVSADSLEHALDTQVKTDVAAQKSQQRVDKLSDQTAEMLAEYRDTLKQTHSLRAYNDQLQTLVNSQKDELASIAEQLKNIETTQRDIVPLMSKMVEVLAQFIELDSPFLSEERHKRVAQLQMLMSRADVSLAEKYRRILEAYQVETEYGRNIEAYQGDLTINDETRTVDFLRIGRMSLYYLTLDSEEVGMWDQHQRQWLKLPSKFIQPIVQSMKVARKQLPPNLLVLPVIKEEAAQ